MKYIVLEINGKEAAVLSDNGAVTKIKNKHYEKGQVVNMKENNKMRFIAKAGSIAALLAITAVSGFAYTNPTSYVSLDVNPSIEYSVNAFDRVVSVTAVNDDGEAITKDLDLKNEKITKAIQKTVDKLIEEGYITEDDNAGIIIAISNSDEEKAEKLAEELETNTQEYMNEKGETAKVEAEAVGKERVEEAKAMGVTPGKLNLVQKLVASSDDADEIDVEEWLNKSVKEINKTINENRKALKDKEITEITEIDEDEDLDEENIENEETDDEDSTIDIENKVKNENKPVKENIAKESNENKPEKLEKDNNETVEEVEDELEEAEDDKEDDEAEDDEEDDDINTEKEVKTKKNN
ncbi:MAG: hypothetical protein WBJ13_15475 [Sedimentibacter sp.]